VPTYPNLSLAFEGASTDAIRSPHNFLLPLLPMTPFVDQIEQ